MASAVSEIGDLGDFELCSSQPSFASEIEVTAGPVAGATALTTFKPTGVQINQELLGFQVHIEQGKDIKRSAVDNDKF